MISFYNFNDFNVHVCICEVNVEFDQFACSCFVFRDHFHNAGTYCSHLRFCSGAHQCSHDVATESGTCHQQSSFGCCVTHFSFFCQFSFCFSHSQTCCICNQTCFHTRSYTRCNVTADGRSTEQHDFGIICFDNFCYSFCIGFCYIVFQHGMVNQNNLVCTIVEDFCNFAFDVVTQQHCYYVIFQIFFQSCSFTNKFQTYVLNLAVSLFHYYENTFTHCRVSSLYF